MTMFENVLEYYDHLVKSGTSDAELERILPSVHALHKFPPKAASRRCDRDPCFALDVDTASTCGKCEHQSIVTADSCQSHGCSWDCVASATSRTPLCHMEFIEIIPEGRQVGIGVTSNPAGKKGIRFCNKNGGVYLDSKSFYSGEDELVISLSSQIEGMAFETGKDQGFLGLAVDYELGQLLLKWPQRKGILRVDLPEMLRGSLLFPLVQAWNGCRLLLKEKPNPIDASGVNKMVAFDRKIYADKVWNHQDNAFHHATEIPTLYPGQAHMIECVWQDQGWGNRKGQLAILTHSASTDGYSENKFSAGRIVASSPTAGHLPSKLRLNFTPAAGATYHLFYKVGGGGGHSLQVTELRVKASSNMSKLESNRGESCQRELRRRDKELKELRQKLEQQKEETINAQVALAEAQSKLERLEASIEVERKDAIPKAERSGMALFEEAERRMLKQHQAMLKQLTKAAIAVGQAAQALGKAPPSLNNVDATPEPSPQNECLPPSPPPGQNVGRPFNTLSVSPGVKRLPREIALTNSEEADDSVDRDGFTVLDDDTSSCPSPVMVEKKPLTWDFVDVDGN